METQEQGGKITTIQLNERTLFLLKKLKEQMNASSYDEVINKKISRDEVKSFAGFLGKYRIKKMSRKDILKDLRDKHDRF